MTVHIPGIDLALIIAAISAIADLASLFFPWLVGLNSEYIPGKGLSYTIVVLLSAFDLFDYSPTLMFLLLPIILTVLLLFLSLRPEGIIPPRISFRTKASVILVVAGLSSILPSLSFVSRFFVGIYGLRVGGLFVGRWELGGGATIPLFAGFGFMLALGLKLIKE